MIRKNCFCGQPDCIKVAVIHTTTFFSRASLPDSLTPWLSHSFFVVILHCVVLIKARSELNVTEEHIIETYRNFRILIIDVNIKPWNGSYKSLNPKNKQTKTN